MKQLGILLSGRGSNFIAIANAIREGRLKGCENFAMFPNWSSFQPVIVSNCMQWATLNLKKHSRAYPKL